MGFTVSNIETHMSFEPLSNKNCVFLTIIFTVMSTLTSRIVVVDNASPCKNFERKFIFLHSQYLLAWKKTSSSLMSKAHGQLYWRTTQLFVTSHKTRPIVTNKFYSLAEQDRHLNWSERSCTKGGDEQGQTNIL